MDRQHRKDLKTDKFAEEVSHTFTFLSDHGPQVKLFGSIGLAVIVIAVGAYFYTGHQATARENALAKALQISDATVAQEQAPASLHYNTAEEKTAALHKAFSELNAKYHGSQEAAIAAMWMASDSADSGKLDVAANLYKDVMDSGPAAYSSLARLALAQVYSGQGKDAEAEKLLRDAVANPSVTVSKDQATIALAEQLAKKNPAEARKLLEPLRSANPAVSRVVIERLAEIANK